MNLKRFGLNAFKVLGGSYSIGKCLSEILNEVIFQNFHFFVLTSKEIKKKLGDLTFITATDGNHGRGVAWMAKHLQQKISSLYAKRFITNEIKSNSR